MHFPARPRLVAVHALMVLAIAACSTSGNSTPSGDSAAAAPPAPSTTPVAATANAAALQVDSLIMTVYKTPTCGCCTKWVDHVRAQGFRATTTDVADVAPVKNTHKVPADLGSCHTALIGGYVVEGHVPAEDIKRLLAERPDIIGIAAPGMPNGSPGMENGRVDRYDVIAIGKDGSRKVWATHGQ